MVAMYCSGFAFAGGEGWSSDFAAAKKEAAVSKKDLLIDFTGSDWCGWCIKLNKEVFSQEPFKVGVKDKFVLVELDYPQDKSKLSAETIKQNEELQKKYPVQGFPTILLTDADGKPYATTGYQAGGPEAYVKHLDELRAKKLVRDESFATAAKAVGVEKAKALVAALAAMGLEDAMIAEFYGDVAEQIKTADPKDETGFAKKSAAKARLATFQSELEACGQKDDHEGALALVDKAVKEGGFSTEDTQQIMLTRAMIFNQQKKFDQALKALDEAKAFAPDSEMAARMGDIKTRIETGKKAEKEDK
jgi:thioredoxin-related protein